MASELIIALSVVAILAAAFAIGLAKVTAHADRRTERHIGEALAQAAVSRQSSTRISRPRASVGTIGLPHRLNTPAPGRVLVGARRLPKSQQGRDRSLQARLRELQRTRSARAVWRQYEQPVVVELAVLVGPRR